MGRRRKGRDISGWLVVDKPEGITSTSVVSKVKWALDAKKAGHAGTLDPEATGVLAVAFGEATKTVPYVTDALKAYEFIVRFGQATLTDDAEGDVTKESNERPADEDIKQALQGFVGDIEQVPPQFSAVKINGERAYAKAREGQAVTLSPRPLYVDSLILIDRPDADHAHLELVCGKGGYVRSVARDLGEALGCFAHVRNLRRVWSGPFDVESAISLQEVDALARTAALDTHLLPLEDALADLPELPVSTESAARLRHGNPGTAFASDVDYGTLCWASENGRAVAIGPFKAGALHPQRVLNT
ncbi:MAG: tRNA pseudouridine(55) synthase TruB [Pseudomonadota bacterium]